MLEMPTFLSWDAFVVAINEAIHIPSPRVDDFPMCPGLVSDDDSSQRYVTPYRPNCATRLKPGFVVAAQPLLHALLKSMIILLPLNSSTSTTVPPTPPSHLRLPPSPHHASWSTRRVLEEGLSNSRAGDTAVPTVPNVLNAATTRNATWTLQACRSRASIAGNPPLGDATVEAAT